MAMTKGRGRTSQLSKSVGGFGGNDSSRVLITLAHPYSAEAASTLPAGLRESVVCSGLTHPTNVEFSQDGRTFVAEKSGLIKVFDDHSDNTPITFADLRTNVHNFQDSGFLGLALDPNFPTSPFVYLLYTYDAQIGGLGDAAGFPGSAVGVVASLAQGTATEEGSDTLINVERLNGSPKDDTLTGSTAANSVRGQGGADTL